MLRLLAGLCGTGHVTNRIECLPKPSKQKLLPEVIMTHICSFLEAEELGNQAGCLNREWRTISSQRSLWKTLLFDKLNGPDLAYVSINKTPLTADSKELFVAARNACQKSYYGKATILTIPEGWCFDCLKCLYDSNDVKKHFSVMIGDGVNARTDLMRMVKKEQTIVLTNSIVRESMQISFGRRSRRFLEDSGFSEKVPDALTMLTLCVVLRILKKLDRNNSEAFECYGPSARCATPHNSFCERVDLGVRIDVTGSIHCGMMDDTWFIKTGAGIPGQRVFLKEENSKVPAIGWPDDHEEVVLDGACSTLTARR